MNINIQQSDTKMESNINDILIAHNIDISKFNNSIQKKKFGKTELHFTLEKIYSYWDFTKACSQIRHKDIKSVIVDENEKFFKAYLIFSHKKISLKKVLEYIVELGYIPAPIKYKKKKYTNNFISGILSNIADVISSIFHFIEDIVRPLR